MTMLAREAGPVQASSLQLANGRWSWWLVRLVVSIYYSGAGWSRSWTNIAPEARIGGYLIDNSNTNILSTKLYVHSWRTINYSIIKNLHKTFRFWYDKNELSQTSFDSSNSIEVSKQYIIKSNVSRQRAMHDKGRGKWTASKVSSRLLYVGCCLAGLEV